jgi:pilus assembly protein CpaB
MKSKTVILMVVAVGCGLVASFLTSRLLAERGKTQDGPVMKKFLVAKKSLSVGTVIKEPEQLFEQKEFPEDSAPKKGFESFDAAKDRKLVKPISADAPLSKDDVLGGDKSDFEASIPQGHQAIAIKVEAQSIVGGFVRPFSKVDVLWTWSRGEGSLAKTILQNLLVLAADTEAGRNEGEPAKLATTVTLAVKPDEAQKIILAQSQGQLTLKLRKTGDDEIDQTRPITIAELVKSTPPSGSGGETDDPDTKDPRTIKTTKPVTDPLDPPPAVEKEPEYFVQTITNGTSRTVAKFPLSGKDTEAVIKTDPLQGPVAPPKKPDSEKTPEKPKTDKESDDK